MTQDARTVLTGAGLRHRLIWVFALYLTNLGLEVVRALTK